MSLSVVQFYSLRPHLPFRYKTEWFLGFWDAKQKEILSYAVTSVTLPKIEIENIINSEEENKAENEIIQNYYND